MTTRRPYTVETVGRGLDHHVTTGALRRVVARPAPSWSAAARARLWTVDVPGAGILDMTTDEAWHLAIGLAAGEARCRRQHPDVPCHTPSV